LSDDTIAYTKIAIPATTQMQHIYLWCEPTSNGETQRHVMFGVNRIPTIDNYDSIIALPTTGEVYSLLDEFPVDSTLYLGLWGGEMLHSYRYFGGFPVYTAVGVVADVSTCDSLLQQGYSCKVYPHIPTMQSSTYISQSDDILQQSAGDAQLTLTVGSSTAGSRLLRLKVNPGLERVQLTLHSEAVSLTDFQIRDVCDVLATESGTLYDEAIFQLKGSLYLDRAPENTHIAFSNTLYDSKSLCATGQLSGQQVYEIAFKDILFDLIKPLPGYWTLVVTANLITSGGGMVNSTVQQLGGSASSAGGQGGWSDTPRTHQTRRQDQTRCVFRSRDEFENHFSSEKMNECVVKQMTAAVDYSASLELERSVKVPVAPLQVQMQGGVLGADQMNISVEVRVAAVTSFCASGFSSSNANISVTDCAEKFQDLVAYSFQDSATHQYTLASDGHNTIQVPRMADEASGGNNEDNTTASLFQSVLYRGNLDGMNFSPAGGAVSIDVVFRPVLEVAGHTDMLLAGDFTIYVQTGSVAHAENMPGIYDNATVNTNEKIVLAENWLQMQPSSAESIEVVRDKKGNLLSKQFRWVYHKPKMAEIMHHHEGDYFIYFYIAANENTPPAMARDGDGRGNGGAHEYAVNMKVTFSPCLESSCKHGECVVSDDGLLVASCSCRYIGVGIGVALLLST
jgi:hypothetical protein